MPTRAFALLLFLAALFAPAAEQATERAFNLTQAQTGRDLLEVATVIRTVAGIRQVFLNHEQKSMTVRSTADDVRLAEWLSGELNQPANTPPPVGPREYRLQGVTDDENLVRIFYTRARTSEELWSIVAGMRSTVKMLPRSFINSARGAVIVRASAEKIAAAEQALQHPK